MLGPPHPRRLDEPVAAPLEVLVPRDNFYRHLEAKLDLGFAHAWARESYADRGRPSIGPVIFIEQQLVMFLEGICSERKPIETASLNLARRWYLGHALDEPLPDHSSLTRFRQPQADLRSSWALGMKATSRLARVTQDASCSKSSESVRP